MGMFLMSGMIFVMMLTMMGFVMIGVISDVLLPMMGIMMIVMMLIVPTVVPAVMMGIVMRLLIQIPVQFCSGNQEPSCGEHTDDAGNAQQIVHSGAVVDDNATGDGHGQHFQNIGGSQVHQQFDKFKTDDDGQHMVQIVGDCGIACGKGVGIRTDMVELDNQQSHQNDCGNDCDDGFHKNQEFAKKTIDLFLYCMHFGTSFVLNFLFSR
jgi:hypothetical protein